jgi:DNA mismatch repair protein MutS
MVLKKNTPVKDTPLMSQYLSIKSQHPDALLLFRVGDFYETFGEDAIEASKILGIILTSRSNGSSKKELAGFPYHSLNTYLPKLVKAGKRVAICEQLEDPKQTKKIVKRGVTELITPGVSLNDEVLDQTRNNFLAAIYFGNDVGVSFLDVSTGEFFIAQGSLAYIKKLIHNFSPSEILYSKAQKDRVQDEIENNYYLYPIDEWAFEKEYCFNKLRSQFNLKSLKGFGVEHMNEGVIASGVILHYLGQNKQDKLSHIVHIKRIDVHTHVWMDRFTIKNLELIFPSNHNGISLIDVIDTTLTPMGSRLLKQWVLFPLKDKESIDNRINIVDFFFKKQDLSSTMRNYLKDIGDIERMLAKISTSRINPKELNKFKESLILSNNIKTSLYKKYPSNHNIANTFSQYNEYTDVIIDIDTILDEYAPVLLSKGNIIKKGVNTDLDTYRELATSSESILKDIQIREIKRTQISSLKISYNNVFGYYLEVRNTHKDKVPEDWIRKQTLVNAERYITEELKELEVKIISAREKIQLLEFKIYQDLVSSLIPKIPFLQKNANIIARLDCLVSFSYTALKNNYYKPSFNDNYDIDIKGSRHPVIESALEDSNEYIPNDIYLDNKKHQIIMITGPNMSGKSAILRQTALIVLMAQIGSFVPAKSAKLGIVDKIFTRVGASDNISQGESTFMVEMNETASILNNLSNRSLVLLDEIGRGTSTFDGVSIAWAIAEYLHDSQYKPKTLFATHYHELNKMSNEFKSIKNFNVSVKESDNQILFLRKLEAGGVEHSFGIHVARMAGMPKSLLKRAREVLAVLESHRTEYKINNKKDNYQLSFIQLDDPIIDEIKLELSNLDIDNLKPLEALVKLNEIKRKIGLKK